MDNSTGGGSWVAAIVRKNLKINIKNPCGLYFESAADRQKKRPDLDQKQPIIEASGPK